MEQKIITSRIGRAPVVLPQDVRAELGKNSITISGKLGSLSMDVHSDVSVSVDGDKLNVLVESEHRKVRALHGLTRALINNMVVGVSKGYMRKLTLIGVGYRANVKGTQLQLEVGKSHDVLMPVPDGIKVEVSKKQDEITLTGIDKAQLGQFAADVIRQRPPEPYKGKGIRHAGQHIKLKAGKKAGKK
jgi:large subunit ribosomal protein L6